MTPGFTESKVMTPQILLSEVNEKRAWVFAAVNEKRSWVLAMLYIYELRRGKL